ncbi:L-rhamnose mutarotase [Galbitalea soli]|uniref:L-rhamnose mutarotase n=1 Tax=Galbitalea soli TaxID=1268042 RepID=A0A7C9PPT5_9MICO|nr:L-rhamnose mutarotase [Galbitalea soli]NEM92507.1 L-rhamnose mutarotase [Galbitalea soli]NYJ29544.1 L-rhamnose mutarotase [Galbitalea soli]
MSEKVCFTLRVKPERIPEYLERHSPVWPEMLQEIARSGRRNYSLFLSPDGLLVGYYETDSDEASAAYLRDSAVATRWEESMQPFFAEADDRADLAATHLPRVFDLGEQLRAVATLDH